MSNFQTGMMSSALKTSISNSAFTLGSAVLTTEILTVPAAIPVTLPSSSTVAIASSLDDHVTPFSVVSAGVKVNHKASSIPGITSVAPEILTAVGKTFAASLTVIVILSLTELSALDVTVIVTSPTAIPFTVPLLTFAMFSSLDVQVTFFSVAFVGSKLAFKLIVSSTVTSVTVASILIFVGLIVSLPSSPQPMKTKAKKKSLRKARNPSYLEWGIDVKWTHAKLWKALEKVTLIQTKNNFGWK